MKVTNVGEYARVVDVELEDLRTTELPATLEDAKRAVKDCRFKRGEIAQRADIVLCGKFVTKSSVGMSGDYAAELRALSLEEWKKYFGVLLKDESALRTGDLVIDLANPDKRPFALLGASAQLVMRAMRHCVEEWGTDTREWRVTTTPPTQWRAEAYRLPPYLAAFVAGFAGTPERVWHRYLVASLEVGTIDEFQFNRMRGFAYQLESLNVKEGADMFDAPIITEKEKASE